MKNFFKTQKNDEKKNPMEESEYCYYQSLGRALVGFAKALELRQGHVCAVTNQDILDYADVDEEEFSFLFGSPVGLLDAVQNEIRKIFADADALLEGMNADSMLNSIFQRLKKNSPVLTVLRLTNNHVIWREVLKNTVLRLSVGWPEAGSEAWEYLNQNYCCQFALILEKWEAADFSDAHIDNCVRLAEIWLEVDAMAAGIAEMDEL